jgi:hypothetical protein
LCGQPTKEDRRPVRLTFTWDESFTVTRKSTLKMRRQGTVHAYLCELHWRRWLLGRVGGVVGVALSVLLMAVGMTIAAISESQDVPLYTPQGIGVAILGFALLICSLFFLAFRTETLTCLRIEGGYLFLVGASPKFLEPLPKAPPTLPAGVFE